MNLDKWHELREKTAELSLRERGILAALTVVVVLVIWLQFIFTPAEKEIDRVAKQKTTLDQRIAEQSSKVAALARSLEHNPNDALRVEQKKLQERLQEMRKEIESRLDNLVPPEKMADLMKEVLSDYKGLRLVSAKNLPVKPIDVNRATKEEGEESEQQAVIFSHGFEMTLTGKYFQTYEFIQRLESMSGFYWQMLDYQVENYPEAIITIQLSTLSLEEDWIGV